MSNPPDFDFELTLRRLVVDNLDAFDATSAQVDNNPEFQRFLLQYNSYRQYIRDVGSIEESMSFLDLLVGFELLIKQKTILGQLGDRENTLPIAIGLINTILDRVDRPIKDILSAEIEKLLEKLTEYENQVKGLYDSELKEGLTGLKDSNNRVGHLYRVLIGDPSDIPEIKLIINDAKNEIEGKIASLQKHFDARVDDVAKKFDDKSKEYKDEIIDKVCEEIPNRVVGESYYRYNATSQFYPTLVLVFLEKTTNKYPRRSQLKVKIKKTSEEITDAFILNLKNEFSILQRKQYRYGPLRACYVSSDKTFKNTIFCSSLDQAIQVFSNVYRIVGLPFDRNNISITSGRNRKPITRRLIPLDGQVPEVQDYESEFEVSLYRAVLQVNGLPKPILVFKDYLLK